MTTLAFKQGGCIAGGAVGSDRQMVTPPAPIGYVTLLYPITLVWEEPRGIVEIVTRKTNGKRVLWTQHDISWDGSTRVLNFNAIAMAAGFYLEFNWDRPLPHGSLVVYWIAHAFDMDTLDRLEFDFV